MTDLTVPSVDGVLTADDIHRTGEAIARVQLPSGAIPWFPGGHTDPWDHIQSAMALTVTGHTTEAVRAYEWCRATQRADGTWAAKYVHDEITDAITEANFCAYLATGVWHHWRVTHDRVFLQRMWPAVRRAIDAVLTLQAPGGQIWWARDPSGDVEHKALLTGNSSMHLSLRCAVALAERIGQLMPDWELAAANLRHALDEHPDRFADKGRFSMDWYYPLLGGVLSEDAVAARLLSRWDDFVVPGLGIRCVADRPWVTGAETCELALALDAVGRPAAAREQLAAMQHLRDPDGSYWTGLVYADGKRWPVERTTWTAATVVLAADALSGATAGSGLFRGEGLAPGVVSGRCTCPATR
jgi:hypothetical protein